MNNKLHALIFIAAAAISLPAAPPTDIIFTGEASWSIASGVAIPVGRSGFWTSGTVPTQLNKEGATVYERYGDTYTQAVSCLRNIEAVLAQQGLTLKDVVYLRVYLTPDAAKSGKTDYPGWFKAYGEFFNNEQNPAKTARSTVGVHSLVSPDWLIEIEAFAVYPAATP
ncbi:MAG: RidA family protein [Candidatus Didemnitutus sp.]|nr:RidA family protein [Candidatus Didemnitutus sp.]